LGDSVYIFYFLCTFAQVEILVTTSTSTQVVFAASFYFSDRSGIKSSLLLGRQEFHCNFTSSSTKQCTVISISHSAYLI